MGKYALDSTLTYGVLGLGSSGASVFGWLKSRGFEHVIGFDSQFTSPGIEFLQKRYGESEFLLGDMVNSDLHHQVDIWIASPGVDISQHPFKQWIGSKPVWNDVELFARAISSYESMPKMIGITGSNGKSTVTKMVEHLLTEAGINAKAAGNIGIPVLELLNDSELPEVVVIELSSFQLEHVYSLELDAATLLNLSPDHLDRHKTIEQYATAKSNIFRRARSVVVNADDEYSVRLSPKSLASSLSFSLQDEQADYFYNDIWSTLVSRGSVICHDKHFSFEGTHNCANALAALALIESIGIDISRVVEHLNTFQALPHRMSLIDQCGGVRWINDSKSTNVGSTLASVASYAANVHLILGGVPKGQDFTPLVSEALLSRCDSIQLIGEAAKDLALLFKKKIKNIDISHEVLIEKQPDLSAVIQRIAEISVPGSIGLLSPACASFDMFENFEDRGHQFTALVHAYCAQFPRKEVA